MSASGRSATPQAFAARAAPERSLLAINVIGLGTIVYKEVRRVLRIWVQTIIPPAITMTLYFVIFGSLIGRRIGEMDGVPYTTFIAPGPDHDGRHPEFLRQRRVVVLLKQAATAS